MAEDPRAKYGLSCPSGGSFYICGTTSTQFVGCCDHDPCAADADDGKCDGNELHPASFSSTNYVDIPPQTCSGSYNESNWWTCQNAKPPFLGCCTSNPCNAGCPDGDLIPSRLSDNATNAKPFLETSSSATTSAPSESTSSAAAATTTTGSPTGLIVGVTMGGIVLLLAGIGFFLWRKRHNEKKQQVAQNEEVGIQNQPQTPGGGGIVVGGGQEPVMMMAQQAQYSPYKDSYPSTVNSSPFPYQSSLGGGGSSGGMTSPPLSSTASTCWSPRDARFSHHDRHTSQISELSGDGYVVHELPPEGSGLQTVPELPCGGGGGGGTGVSYQIQIQNEGSPRPPEPGGGIAHVPRIAHVPSASEFDLGRRYHELDGRYQ